MYMFHIAIAIQLNHPKISRKMKRQKKRNLNCIKDTTFWQLATSWKVYVAINCSGLTLDNIGSNNRQIKRSNVKNVFCVLYTSGISNGKHKDGIRFLFYFIFSFSRPIASRSVVSNINYFVFLLEMLLVFLLVPYGSSCHMCCVYHFIL